MNKRLNDLVILVKGGGEMATGVTHRLASCHLNVCMTETSEPQAVRREVAFSEAIFDQEKEVEGVVAKRIELPEQIRKSWREGRIPILVDPEAKVKDFLKPDVLIDATLAKKNLGTGMTDALLVIGLGPGFQAGRDVHRVIETNRGPFREGSFKPYWSASMDKSLAERKYIFGPVPSRRLGRSLGVDLVPYKTCTFDCIYCDLGRTTHKTTSRQPFVSPEEVRNELELTLLVLEKKPDFITLSGSGEPTLNSNIGQILRGVKEISSIPVVVLTNSSLLPLEEVRKDLLEADVVLPSLDAITPSLFQYINRPHSSLNIDEILSGLIQFRKQYRGQIWMEILFCRGVNDGKGEIEKLKEAIKRIEPDRIQLNTPVRPPAEDFAFPLTLTQLEEIRETLGDKAEIVSEFSAPMGEESTSMKDAEILNLIKRRPCTAEDISRALGLHLGEVVKYLEKLVKDGAVHYRMYEHRGYYESGTT